MTKTIYITIIDYPNSLQSAVQGLKEFFLLTNKITMNNHCDIEFVVNIALVNSDFTTIEPSDIIIIPPNFDGDYYNSPQPKLLAFLCTAHRSGSILCSACAGTFILAETGILDNRAATTHWLLADKFIDKYSKVSLKADSLLINDGDIITAGGLMSWVDLGLEIVAQYTHPYIMRALGKYLIVDTGNREQRYYRSFTPQLNHGNEKISHVQHYIQKHYNSALNVRLLADLACMTERTFLRHFTDATRMKPIEYIQKVRVQKACELLEQTTQSFEKITENIGYDDVNSFRKVFFKVTGLSPSAFKSRFVRNL